MLDKKVCELADSTIVQNLIKSINKTVYQKTGNKKQYKMEN